jgi:hypothetical protein
LAKQCVADGENATAGMVLDAEQVVAQASDENKPKVEFNLKDLSMLAFQKGGMFAFGFNVLGFSFSPNISF